LEADFLMKKDGHMHTPYCPHGTKDSFHLYIERAISSGFEEITFTEHAPLPLGFIDPTPDQDSGMNMHHLESYISELQKLKKEYNKDIVISIGLEVDFISGYEHNITTFLNTYGKYLDDSILSVHFLKFENDYVCIDFSKTIFAEFVERLGNPTSVYKLYYKTLLDSITSNLGNYKPKRIGHVTLVHKFQHILTEVVQDHEDIITVLNAIKQHRLELDVNTAGLAKPYCLEIYPPLPYIKLAKELEIPLVFGSDAHQAQDLHQFYNKIKNLL